MVADTAKAHRKVAAVGDGGLLMSPGKFDAKVVPGVVAEWLAEAFRGH